MASGKVRTTVYIDAGLRERVRALWGNVSHIVNQSLHSLLSGSGGIAPPPITASAEPPHLTSDDLDAYVAANYPEDRTRKDTLRAVAEEIGVIKSFYGDDIPVSREHIYSYIDYVKSKKNRQGEPIATSKVKKYLNRYANVLEYFSKRKGQPIYKELATILRDEASRLEIVKRAPPKITLKEVQDVLRAVYNKPYKQEARRAAFTKLRLLSALILQAYTGIRPEILNRATQSDFDFRYRPSDSPDEGLYPHLHVRPEMDKIKFEHDVPLHPDAVLWLKAYFRAYESHSLPRQYKPKSLWNTGGLRGTLEEACRQAGVRYLDWAMIRKFAEQAHKWRAHLPDFARVIIMAHEVGKLSKEHYDYVDAARLYPVYIEHWGDIHIVPKDVRLDKLMEELGL